MCIVPDCPYVFSPSELQSKFVYSHVPDCPYVFSPSELQSKFVYSHVPDCPYVFSPSELQSKFVYSQLLRLSNGGTYYNFSLIEFIVCTCTCIIPELSYIFSPTELQSQFAGRFSKSANERETMLEDRKNQMLEQAKR